MQVIKRDGRAVSYDRSKIIVAIQKANAEVEDCEKISEEKIEEIIDGIEAKNRKRMLVEDIQDIIEQKIMAEGKFVLAKTYIIYRYSRELIRKANTTDDSILSLIQNRNKDVMEENSNKNATVASTQRDLIAGEVSKDLTKRLLLPEKISKAQRHHFSTLSEEEKRKATEKARASIDRKKQGTAASKGIKAWWAKLKSNPDAYKAYIEARTKTLLKNRSKHNENI